MADLDLATLAASLLGTETQKEIAASNPYFTFQSLAPVANEIGLKAYQQVKEPDSKDLKDLAIISGVSGLVSGLLGGLGADYQSKLSSRYVQALEQAKAGQAITVEGLPQGLFDSVNQKAAIWRMVNEANAVEQKNELKQVAATEAIKSQARVSEDLIKTMLTADRPEDRTKAENMLRSLTGAPPKEGGVVPAASSEEAALADEIGYKGVKDIKIAKQKAENLEVIKKQEWFKQIPAAQRTTLIGAIGTIDSIDNLAKDFKSLGVSWEDWQINSKISGTPEYALKSRMMTLVPSTVRLLGDVGNLAEHEQQRILDATLGNITSKPEDIASRLDQLAKLTREKTIVTLNSAKTAIQGGGDALVSALQAKQGAAPAAALPIAAQTPAPAAALTLEAVVAKAKQLGKGSLTPEEIAVVEAARSGK